MNLALLDVSQLFGLTDIFVIATGTSRPHVRTLAEFVEERLHEAGHKPIRSEGATEAEWVLIDFGDIIVHLFQPGPRDFYALERLWGDAPRVPWEEPVVSES